MWEAAPASALSVGSLITGQILWKSLLQRCVPGEYLGRVASVDSFVSSGLVPLSLAITGPGTGRRARDAGDPAVGGLVLPGGDSR